MFEPFNEPSKYYELPIWKLKGIAPVPNGRSVFSTAQSWAAKMKGFGRSMGGGEPEFESAVDLKTLKKLIDWRVPFRFRVKRMFRWVNYEWTGEDIVGMDGGGKVERLLRREFLNELHPLTEVLIENPASMEWWHRQESREMQVWEFVILVECTAWQARFITVGLPKKKGIAIIDDLFLIGGRRGYEPSSVAWSLQRARLAAIDTIFVNIY